MRTTFAAIAAAAALTLALSGCTESEPREPEPSWTPSSTPEQPSTTPAAHDSLTVAPEGETARQFIRRWVGLINLIQRTGDAAPYRAISGPDCRSCKSFATRVEKIYAAGGFVRTRGSRITDLRNDGNGQWTVTLHAAPTEYRKTRSAATQRLGGGRYSYVVYIGRVSGDWRVASYIGSDS